MGTEHRDAFYERGWTLRSNGRSDLAAREFEQALAVDPNHARSHAMLALCRYDAADHARAVESARTALSLDPTDAFVVRTMGWTLLGAGRPLDAVGHALQSLQLEPRSYEGAILLGEGMFQSGDYEGALSAADQAVRVDPSAAGGHRIRSSALRMLRRLDKSRDAAETAMGIAPGEHRSHLVLARVATEQRDFGTAAAGWREALRMDPSNAEARHGLVQAIKLRNPAYRWADAFHRWFFSIPQVVRVVLMLGVMLLTAGIGGIVVVVAVVAGKTVDPVANLVLRFDRYGRQLLSAKQIQSSDWIASATLCLAAALVAVLLRLRPGPVMAAAFVGACLPVAACARNCRPGRATKAMVVYAAVLVAMPALVWVCDRCTENAFKPDQILLFGVFEFGAVLAAVAGFAFGFRFARRCGYPWSHRFDAPSR